VRAEVREPVTDLAVDATLRAAALHQVRRGRREGDPLRLERHDLRQKVRERKVGNLTVFVVDASASMDAERRMAQTKAAILSLLHDAYVRRDRVALVVFKDRSAEVVLPPTSSVSLARRRLASLPIGGTTPLAHGLLVGYNVIRTATLRDPSLRPLLVLISDGEGNVAMSKGPKGKSDPLADAQRVAGVLASRKIDALVIDTTRTADAEGIDAKPTYMRMYHHYARGTCADLAKRMQARYYGLADLPKGQLAAAVIAHLKSR
jgi:magnesium chelatase subunit D